MKGVCLMGSGDRIKDLRKKQNLTQKQLAIKVHVSPQVISNWERGYSTPDSEDLKKIAESLDTSTDYLLGREEKRESLRSNEDDFEKWMTDPKVNKFYKEFNESPEERREALMAVWEILKKQGKY